MQTQKMTRSSHTYTILEEVPEVHDSDILTFLNNKQITWKHLGAIKRLTASSDDEISGWLNLSARTLREYKKAGSVLKGNIKEHVLILLAFVKHGVAVFGTTKALDQWLKTENFYFDNRRPEYYLNTITGIKFLDDRLTAMEYGDNV